MRLLAVGIAALIALAAYADWTLPHQCRTCKHLYAGRAALNRHRRKAHRA